MADRIVRQFAQANETLTGNVLRTIFDNKQGQRTNISQAYRGTKMHVYLPYQGTIPFWLYLVPLRLVSAFLHVRRVEISCRLFPTRFSLIFL